jgi:hypothetical protein
VTEAEILRRARETWAARELTFPRFVRQTWEQGTWAARMAALAEASRDRGSKPDRAETVQQGSVHESPGSASAEIAKGRSS